MTHQHAEVFDAKNFETEVLNSNQPVLVDFWAEWCGPCRDLAPVIDDLADGIGDQAKVGKLNIDSNSVVAQQYDVQSIPTVLVFHNGEVVDRLIGVQPKHRYEEAVRSLSAA